MQFKSSFFYALLLVEVLKPTAFKNLVRNKITNYLLLSFSLNTIAKLEWTSFFGVLSSLQNWAWK